MSHPESEEWMAFLYGELPRKARYRLQAHLDNCPECRRQVGEWQTSMTSLQEWKIPRRARALAPGVAAPILKWALAALVVLGLGYGIGHVTATVPQSAALQSVVQQKVQEQIRADWQAVLADEPDALTTDFRRELKAGLDQVVARATAETQLENRRWLAQFMETYQTTRQDDRKTFLALLNQTEQKRQVDHLNLRRAIETVAVVAADKFQRTETELGNLANFAEAQFASAHSNEPFNSNQSSNRKGN